MSEVLVNAETGRVKYYFISPVTRLTRQVELLPSCSWSARNPKGHRN